MGGKSKTKSESNSVTRGWQPVMDQAQNTILPNINEWSQNYGQGQGLWSGSQLGSQDYNVTQGQDAMLGYANQYGKDFGQVRNTLQGFLDYDPNSFQNQASRDALGANARAQFSEVIQPGIEDIGTRSGQFGGNQQNLALGAATAPLSRAIADNEVNLMNADKDRAFNAMLNANNIMEGGFRPGQVQEAVGNQRTARNQLEQMDMIAQFEAPASNAARAIQMNSGLLSPWLNAETTTNSENTQTSKGDALQTVAGIGLMAADMYFTGGLGSLAKGAATSASGGDMSGGLGAGSGYGRDASGGIDFIGNYT